MKRLFLLLTLLGLTFQLKAQLFLVLRNGNKVEFKDFANSNAEFIRIKTKEGKREFRVEEVDCFYDLTYVPAFPKRYNQFESLHYIYVKNGDVWMSPVKVLEGSINLYRRAVTQGKTWMFIYFLEKDSEMVTIEESGLFTNKKEKIGILRKYMSDAPSLITKMESEDFKYSDESLFDIIKEYNTFKFQKMGQQNAKMSSVFFYSRVKKTTKEDLKLVLNDSIEVMMPANRLVAAKVAIDALTKICVSSSSQSDCLLVSGSPYFIRYFEVDYNQKKEKLEVKPVHSVDAQNYIRFANSQGN